MFPRIAHTFFKLKRQILMSGIQKDNVYYTDILHIFAIYFKSLLAYNTHTLRFTHLKHIISVVFGIFRVVQRSHNQS